MISIENPDGTIEPSVTLTVGTSLADNSKAETTYHSVIQTSSNNIDQFTVTYTTGKTDVGYTTENVNQIQFQGRANVYTPIAVYLQHGKINKKRRKDGLQKSVLRHLNKK
jgi:hypothetical protein